MGKLFLPLLASTFITQAASAQEVSLSAMISAVQGALVDAQQQLERDQMLPLNSVSVRLNTINARAADGKIGFWMFVIGTDVKDTVTSTVEMKLTPPPPDASDPVATATQIREALASAIFEGAAARSEAIQGTPPLVTTEFTITLEFALIADGRGGVKLAVPPFDLGVGASVEREKLQQIVLDFGNEEDG